MTTIVIGLEALSGVDPGTKPIGGYFQVYPYAAEKLTSGGYLTTAMLGVTVVNGTASVVIPPTGAGEAVVFNPVSVPGMSKRIVAIPDSDIPVLYEDLVDLDPSTLDPAAPLTPAWLTALQGWKFFQLADVNPANVADGDGFYWNAATQKMLPGAGGGGGSGTVTSVSVQSANGFAGTVATPGTTPAITMEVTFNGIAKGNGSALSAAAAADIISTLGYTPASASAIPANTDALPQGATNLYFTPVAARAAVSLTAGASGASYTPSTGVFDLSGVQAALGFTPENAANKGAAGGYAPLNAENQVPVANLPALGASGSGHAAGLVPDPGATAGATRFLCEDATWQTPPGIPAPINILSQSSDATLAVGQLAYASVSAVSTLALKIATGDLQDYEITIEQSAISSAVNHILLLPNNVTGTNLFKYTRLYGESGAGASGAYNNGFTLSAYQPQKLIARVSTGPAAKTVLSTSQYGDTTDFVIQVIQGTWVATASSAAALDTTTHITSLGTLVFDSPLTAYITVRRIR